MFDEKLTNINIEFESNDIVNKISDAIINENILVYNILGE